MAGILSVLNLLLILFFLTLPSPLRGEDPPRKIVIGGAQSIAPLAEQFSAQFRQSHPGVEVEIRRANSNYAVEAVRSGQIHIGLITRALAGTEKANIRSETMGHDAMILLSYPRNSVASLTLEQLRNIYVGKIINWRDLGGEDKGIVPLTREKNSALHGTFIDRLYGKGFNGQEKAFVLRASKDKILRTIKRVRGSVGYGIVSLEEAQAQGVKALAADGVLPTAANLKEGLYPFTRSQLVISNVGADGMVRDWITEFVKFAHRRAAQGSAR
ncbi:MAG: substrate-binding domain-containing protein [Deltaproteobacteria bacterium]|nr:substrate-binding domain-containing protein [Deltaproteobacteria bacterium]